MERTDHTQLNAAPPLVLSGVPDADADRIRKILEDAARRLNAANPDTAMSENARFTHIQIAVWEYHGRYDDVNVGDDITATLTAVRDLPLTGSRDEYAARLRLALRAVTL
ncbi:hypothetical protein [Streptomyces chryseus]|uniref:hypothetical protein n=1 Tax=Streptomyces chryseus TaxID=68186 RepID=UPI00110F8404|nr:hypothetical protein [Streptomyces chryseus]GGX02063.1 hypothetical protein GCM10010353_17140 [Streptomyces chryseus]